MRRPNTSGGATVPKSPDSLLAIFSNDRPSEELLEELGADDILEESEGGDADATGRVPSIEAEVAARMAEAAPEPVKAEAAPEPVKAEAAPAPVKVEAAPEPVKVEAAPEPVKAAPAPALIAPIAVAKIAAPKIIEAPMPSDPEMGEPTIVLERKAMDEAAAEQRSEPAADRTMRMPRSDVFRAAQALASVPPAPITARVLPSSGPAPRATAPRAQHGSIAPVAFDLAAQAPSPPVSKSPGLVIGVAAAAFVLLAGSITAGVLLGKGPSVSAASQTAATAEPTATPRAATVEGASTAVIDATPQTASAKDTAKPVDPQEMPSSDVSSLPSAPSPGQAAPAPAHESRPVAAHEPKPAPAPAATHESKPAQPQAREAAAPAPTTHATHAAAPAAAPARPAAAAPAGVAPTVGIIRVPVSDSIVTIKVDGSYRRVHNGSVAVTCGHHNVQVGSSIARDIDVPCGGAASVD
jgi:hypothetical protein